LVKKTHERDDSGKLNTNFSGFDFVEGNVDVTFCNVDVTFLILGNRSTYSAADIINNKKSKF